jgi:uncharacterized protein (TIGR02266 family)
MSEDTRKDKRAKIVSLNVRYKSATVDEFIENHSHDVSKGGIFIKTPTPFPPGTLIKFEIRIANDRAVIMGVGRVVWKRDPSQAAGERPSGMGVKFIKIDDSSRQLIDRVVAEKEGAGAAYSGDEDGSGVGAKSGARPLSDRPLSAVPSEPAPRPGLGALRPGEARKETIMGIGSATPQAKPAAAGGGSGAGMFPSTSSAPEAGPVKEKTVMKQAAELLEEALKEAGGSMDEIGNNPLFAEGNKLTPRVAPVELEREKSKKGTLLGMPGPGSSGSIPAGKPATDPPRPAGATRTSDSPKDGTSDASPRRTQSAKITTPPPTTKETPSAKVATESTPPRQRRTDPPAAGRSARPAAVAAVAELPTKKAGGSMLWVLVLLIVAGGVAFVYKDNLLGTQAPPPPLTHGPVVTPPPPPPPAAAASEAPSAAASAGAAPSASASAAPSATASAPSAVASASGKAAPTAAPAVTTAAPAPVSTPAPTVAAPAPAPKPKPAPAPTPAATTASTDTTAPAPAPKPKPKPKPTAAPDDNPY